MLSIISYNVMFNDVSLEQRHKALVALLRKNSPDVICLQEVLAELVPWFINQLPDYNPVISYLQPTGRPYGELIFVKKDITQLAYQCEELPSKMGRALQHLTLEKDSVRYNVITFHLESLNCSKVRRTQLGKLWEYTKDLQHVVCCGDTNQTAKESCVLPDRIRDAWEQTDGKIGEYTYFSGRFWDGDRKQRYDKVWFSDDLKLAGFGILGNKPVAQSCWISDHDGLFALLKTINTNTNG